MSEQESLGEQLLDLLLYAPIGLLLEARDLVPKLADRGRGQVALTRLASKVAGKQGQLDAGSLLRQLLQAAGVAVGSITRDDHNDSDEFDDHNDHEESAGDDSGLPIENYNAFSAPQLLHMLEALDQGQLAAIGVYERTHRDRRTVTNRVQQLSLRDDSVSD